MIIITFLILWLVGLEAVREWASERFELPKAMQICGKNRTCTERSVAAGPKLWVTMLSQPLPPLPFEISASRKIISL